MSRYCNTKPPHCLGTTSLHLQVLLNLRVLLLSGWRETVMTFTKRFRVILRRQRL